MINKRKGWRKDHATDPYIFDLARIALIIISPEGNIIKANPEAVKLFNESTSIHSRHITELFSFEEPFNISAWYKKVLDGSVTKEEFRVRYIAEDGMQRTSLLSLHLCKNDQWSDVILGQLNYQEKSLNDNTEDLYQRQILLELINNIPDNIFIKDTESRFILANRWVSQVMGAKSPEELIGKTDFDFHPKKLAQKYRQDEREIISSGKAKLNIIEQVIDTNLGRHWYSTSKIPLKDPKGNIIGIMGIGRDITPWVKKQKELRKAKHAAEKADQLKSAFLSNLSHEIRTPLNAILGFSQFLRQFIEPDTKGNQYIDFIVHNGKQLLHLISDIIDLSKIDSGQLIINKKKFNLNELMHQLEHSIRETLSDKEKSHIELVPEIPLEDDESLIYSDEHRLKQIMHNLLLNAVKFTHDGSIKFGYTVVGNGIKFYVKDTGIGIPPEQLGLIFERFTQADNTIARQYEGAGIGLTIARGLARLMGSDLNVISEVSKGSEFYFTLPASGDFMKRTKRKIQELEAELLSILVLGTVRKYDKQLVASLKNRAEICYSKSISDLCQKLRSTSQFPDIVLCYPDSDMDEASTLINDINTIMPEVPILVITRVTRSLFIEECLVAGARDYLSDPYDIELLHEKIELLTHKITRQP